jgi:RNA polymerase sigma factor for flagellar operon FliA
MELDDASLKEFAVTVKYYALRYAHRLPPELDLDDLVSVGMTGLLDAARRFDPSRGIKFKTMAEHRIRGAMLDEIRSVDWIPRSVRDKASQVNQVRDELMGRLHREPTDEELSAGLGIDEEAYRKLAREIEPHAVLSLEDLMDNEDGDGPTLMDRIASGPETDPLENCLRREVTEALTDAIDQLPEKQRLVLSLYYYDELTMKEVAQVLGVSESRVSQIHTQAIHALKKALLVLKDASEPTEGTP